MGKKAIKILNSITFICGIILFFVDEMKRPEIPTIEDFDRL